MPEQPIPTQDVQESILTIKDFGGLAPNQDPHDLKPGETIHQVNCGVSPRGELRVRLGAAVVRFVQTQE